MRSHFYYNPLKSSLVRAYCITTSKIINCDSTLFYNLPDKFLLSFCITVIYIVCNPFSLQEWFGKNRGVFAQTYCMYLQCIPFPLLLFSIYIHWECLFHHKNKYSPTATKCRKRDAASAMLSHELQIKQKRF